MVKTTVRNVFQMTKIVEKKFAGLQSRNVVLSNALVRSAQGLTLAEKRILMAAISRMDGVMQPIEITAQEYADTFHLPVRQAYEQLRESAKAFLTKHITYLGEHNGHKGVFQVNWLSTVFYTHNEGFITVEFNPKLMPELCDLQQHFTQYQLKRASSLRSVHSWRLMELLQQMKNSESNDGWLIIGINEFHHAMESTDSYKANFGRLRARVIEPAIKELQDKDGWKIDWGIIKVGRKVSSLKFRFSHQFKEIISC